MKMTQVKEFNIIYIPIWLDLLSILVLDISVGFHLFTFQYG